MPISPCCKKCFWTTFPRRMYHWVPWRAWRPSLLLVSCKNTKETSKENRKGIPLKTTSFVFLFFFFCSFVFSVIHAGSKQFKQYRKVKFPLYFSLSALPFLSLLFIGNRCCYFMYPKISSPFTKIYFHFLCFVQVVSCILCCSLTFSWNIFCISLIVFNLTLTFIF